MKKTLLTLSIVVILLSQPTSIGTPIELEPGKTVIKIDANTCEVTITRTTTTIVSLDRRELELQRDELIPTQIAKLQEEIANKNERIAEINEILKVFD